MIFIKWFIFAIFDLLFVAQCYITNPIVCLFADEYGNLPKALRWWQTWDNTLDVEWMVTEKKVPSTFRYDYARHYVYHYENHDAGIAGYVDIIDPSFSLWERTQRYFCRLAWLYRNTGYGFSYEVTGVDVVSVTKYTDYSSNGNRNKLYVADNAFMFRYEQNYSDTRKIRIWLGWKIEDAPRRCMLAFYVNFFRKR